MKYILIWVITATNGVASGGFTSGSSEFGSYEACRAAGNHMSTSTGSSPVWQWNCVPYELEPGQKTLTDSLDSEAR